MHWDLLSPLNFENLSIMTCDSLSPLAAACQISLENCQVQRHLVSLNTAQSIASDASQSYITQFLESTRYRPKQTTATWSNGCPDPGPGAMEKRNDSEISQQQTAQKWLQRRMKRTANAPQTSSSGSSSGLPVSKFQLATANCFGRSHISGNLFCTSMGCQIKLVHVGGQSGHRVTKSRCDCAAVPLPQQQQQ